MKQIPFRSTEEFKKRLEQASKTTGVRMSEIIRRAVDKYLKELGF